ncbi:hypothetical protein [Candidatus Paracaedibacter symbiosus]|uniref:hypothetical protein n=1 Tax=Candidatus Paracaedibacter symbiosus TaxID=244582 RepID=UPI0005094E88|nr:hypothetical protein [Candidatus Paracaedibacter symbiosus]
MSGGSFGPTNDNYWRVVVNNEKDFIKRLDSYDIIIVLPSDQWMNDIISKLTRLQTAGLQNYAIVKNAQQYGLIIL